MKRLRYFKNFTYIIAFPCFKERELLHGDKESPYSSTFEHISIMSDDSGFLELGAFIFSIHCSPSGSVVLALFYS